MDALIQVMCPSMNRALQPLPWKANASPFGPQSPNVHGQPAGPPTGTRLLLMTCKLAWPNVAPGGPEIPSAQPGSAHRQAFRYGEPLSNSPGGLSTSE